MEERNEGEERLKEGVVQKKGEEHKELGKSPREECRRWKRRSKNKEGLEEKEGEEGDTV